MPFAPLHNHSQYSALDGLSTPEEIADRCVEIGCPCCGLTDHGLVAGHLHFAKALEAKSIKPIFGCELYHGVNTSGVFAPKERDQAHLIALAMTNEGLRNLWRLVHRTSQADRFHNVGRVFWEDIEECHEGIVFTSACALSLVSKTLADAWRNDTEPEFTALNHYLDIIGDNFYIEIHTYPHDHLFRDRDSDFAYSTRALNEALVDLAQERGIPLVYADDAHRAFPNQYWAHDAYVAIQTGDSIHTPPEERSMWHPKEALVIHDEEGVRKALEYLPDAVVEECLANSLEIAERATARLPEVKRHLPMFVPGDCPWLSDERKQLDPDSLFIDLVLDGIHERYDNPPPESEVWDRVIYEVETCLRDDIHHYFLMGWDELQAAKSMRIPVGPGRGSSAGAIVAYALGITDVDPLHYGLIFERFWNSGRAKGFPDIDSDFSRARRKDLIAYLEQRWGSDRVCAIGTTIYMKPKSAIDKLAKGCGITFDEAVELKEIVGKTTKIDILGHEQIGWSREYEPGKKYYVKDEVGGEIVKWIQADKRRANLRQTFVNLCEICCSRVKQYGIHASGIVISDVPLDAELPAYRRGGKEGVPATQFTMADVDDRMFIKLDVLGLRTLDMVGYWEELVAEHDIDIEWSGLDKTEEALIPEMWDILKDKNTAGIFQVEDGYGRQLCHAMEPRSVEDLAALGALNRPGPIQAKIPDEYVARRKGVKPITYIHPRMEELVGESLAPTYGLFVYQEQIIAFFNALGYTLSESDAVRKIMGKKKPEQMDAVRDGKGEWEDRGYLQMAQRAGLPLEVAQAVWDDLEGFADYCLSGDTVVVRGGANRGHKPEITLCELATAWMSDTPLGRKLRWRGVTLLAMDSDGRIRPARATRVWSNGIKPVYQVITEGNRSFKATGNHKVLTDHGYVRCDALQVGDALVAMGGKEPQYIPKGRQTDRAKGRSYNGCGTPAGVDNPSWIDGRTKALANAKREVSARAQGACEVCDNPGDNTAHSLEYAHTRPLDAFDGDLHQYHSATNLRLLCNGCHKTFDYAKGERKKRWTKGRSTLLDHIRSIEYAGEEEVFDVTMESSEHNFVGNDIVVHNCFNKSHAVAYAIIGFRTLYAKYYAAAQAFAANLRSLDPSADSDKRKTLIPEYVNECRRLNIEARPPDMRYAKGHAYVDPLGRLLFGFSDVRNIANSGDYIVVLRDNVGLAHSTPDQFRAAFEQYNKEFLALKKANRATGRSPKQRLRINQIDALEKAGSWDDLGYRDISLTERQQNEIEMLGVILTDNTAEVLDYNAEEIAGCDSWSELLTRFDDKSNGEDEYLEHRVCGIVSNISSRTSKKTGKPFGVVNLEYGPDSIELMVWNSQFRTFKRIFSIRSVGIFTVKHHPAGEYDETYSYVRGHILK